MVTAEAGKRCLSTEWNRCPETPARHGRAMEDGVDELEDFALGFGQLAQLPWKLVTLEQARGS